MTTIRLSERAKIFMERYIHWILIFAISGGVFLIIMIMNPQTLVWVGLVQLDCNLPGHSKCVAENPLKNLFGGD